MTDQALTPQGSNEPTDCGRLAYARLLDEIDAVPDAKLISVNLDVLKVVTKALGVSRAAARFAEQAKTLPPGGDLLATQLGLSCESMRFSAGKW